MVISQEPIALSCAADDLFAMPLAVTVRSVLDNLNRDRKVLLFILDGGIRESNRRKILESFASDRIEVQWVKPPSEALKKLYFTSDSNYPIAAYYRLLLPDLVPDRYRKIVYLDTDVIVVEDLAKLWSIPFGENYMLAAMDAANRSLSWPEHLQHLDLDGMGVSGDTKYLQSGVLLIDLEKWRLDHISDRLIEFITDHLELPYPDMDALNFVLAGKWGELDPRWNQIPAVYGFESWEASPYTQEELRNVVHDPYIIHYGDNPKPWERRCTHPKTSLWYDYLNRTAWAGWQVKALDHSVRLGRRIARRLWKVVNRGMLAGKSLMSSSKR